MNRLTAAVLLLGLSGSPLAGCEGKQLAHSGENPVYPLRGLHAAVPCEGCHGPGTPQKLPTACIDCHDDDRPDPDHNPGQDCYGCHVEEGWEIVETTITLPTGDTGPTTTAPDPGFDHSPLPTTQLCWECHEVERKDPVHYANEANPLLSWDCQGCHTATAWDYKPIEHPTRVPHGARSEDCEPTPEAGWQIGCEGCHPSGTATFTCQNGCHDNVHDGTWPESQCLVCHIAGEPQGCN